MATTIRLARHGSKKRPFYRIVAASKKSPRDGRFLEQLGHYDPTSEPVNLRVHLDKVEKWIRNGAKPSDTVAILLKQAGWTGLPAAEAAPAAAEVERRQWVVRPARHPLPLSLRPLATTHLLPLSAGTWFWFFHGGGLRSRFGRCAARHMGISGLSLCG